MPIKLLKLNWEERERQREKKRSQTPGPGMDITCSHKQCLCWKRMKMMDGIFLTTRPSVVTCCVACCTVNQSVCVDFKICVFCSARVLQQTEETGRGGAACSQWEGGRGAIICGRHRCCIGRPHRLTEVVLDLFDSGHHATCSSETRRRSPLSGTCYSEISTCNVSCSRTRWFSAPCGQFQTLCVDEDYLKASRASTCHSGTLMPRPPTNQCSTSFSYVEPISHAP